MAETSARTVKPLREAILARQAEYTSDLGGRDVKPAEWAANEMSAVMSRLAAAYPADEDFFNRLKSMYQNKRDAKEARIADDIIAYVVRFVDDVDAV